MGVTKPLDPSRNLSCPPPLLLALFLAACGVEEPGGPATVMELLDLDGPAGTGRSSAGLVDGGARGEQTAALEALGYAGSDLEAFTDGDMFVFPPPGR